MTPLHEVTLEVPHDQDVGALGAVHLLSWQQTHPSAEHGVDAAWIDEHLGWTTTPAGDDARRRLIAAQQRDPGTTFYRLARHGAAVVGFVHASRPSPSGEDEGDGDGEARLGSLYLLRSHQGTGLADRVMAATSDWLGGRAVRLEVATYNLRAIRFYERHGFRTTGEAGLFRDRVPTVIMRRPGPR